MSLNNKSFSRHQRDFPFTVPQRLSFGHSFPNGSFVCHDGDAENETTNSRLPGCWRNIMQETPPLHSNKIVSSSNIIRLNYVYCYFWRTRRRRAPHRKWDEKWCYYRFTHLYLIFDGECLSESKNNFHIFMTTAFEFEAELQRSFLTSSLIWPPR